jgi:hypothetical protein
MNWTEIASLAIGALAGSAAMYAARRAWRSTVRTKCEWAWEEGWYARSNYDRYYQAEMPTNPYLEAKK